MAFMTNQLQRWAMIILAGAVVLFVIIHFVVAPMMRATNENRKMIQTMREQLNTIGEVIGTGTTIQRNLTQTRAAIRLLAENIPLPMLGNYLLSREQHIRACCAGLNIQISSVTEYDVLNVVGWNSSFKIYRVRVMAQSGINDLARCFYAIQKSNPLSSVSAITVTPQEGIPDVHSVSFVVAWLIWANPDKRPTYLVEPEPKTVTLTPDLKP